MTTPTKSLRFSLSAAMANDPANPATPKVERPASRYDVSAAMARRIESRSTPDGSAPATYNLADAMRRRVAEDGARQ